MCPTSHQPSRLFATAKTQKFSSIKDITLENLKLRSTIDLRRTYINNALKVIVKYLQPYAKKKIPSQML